MDRAETIAFNRGFLPHFSGWYSRIEYAPGGSPGNPDAILLAANSFLPVEVKVAHAMRDGSFKFKVRPSQLIWHRSLALAGGLSAFFIYADEDRCWWMPGWQIEEMTDGLDVLECAEISSVMTWLPAWIKQNQIALRSRNNTPSENAKIIGFKARQSPEHGHEGYNL